MLSRCPRKQVNPDRLPALITVALLLLVPRSAAAYIDPGTGSALFYVVAGIVVSIYFAVRGAYYRLIDLLFRVRYRDQKCEIAVHCEEPRYEITFLPIIRKICASGTKVAFFTMYPRDDSYAALPEFVVHRELSPGMVGYAYLNNIEAALLVTTTPQIDVMTFRRSKRVQHFAMVQHALGECRYVRPFAYDYFDSVLCCGPILKANIRKMEEIRDSQRKELFETGLSHYEPLLERAESSSLEGSDVVVLVAPSWGPLSMFESFGVDFVEAISARFQVVIRPHPQMRVSQPELYSQILQLEGVEVDTARTPSDAMSRADVLLSDISGISHEFAFIYERPVVVVDQKEELGGLEGEVLGGDSELKLRCQDFIVPVPPSEINNIADHLERALATHSAERIREIRSELVYEFGTASTRAAEQLISIYRHASSRETTE